MSEKKWEKIILSNFTGEYNSFDEVCKEVDEEINKEINKEVNKAQQELIDKIRKYMQFEVKTQDTKGNIVSVCWMKEKDWQKIKEGVEK